MTCSGRSDRQDSPLPQRGGRPLAPAGELPALVLNADYTPLSYYPLSLWPWQTAIKAVFLERVDIVASYERLVHSPSLDMQIPSVIALRQYVKPSEFRPSPASTVPARPVQLSVLRRQQHRTLTTSCRAGSAARPPGRTSSPPARRAHLKKAAAPQPARMQPWSCRSARPAGSDQHTARSSRPTTCTKPARLALLGHRAGGMKSPRNGEGDHPKGGGGGSPQALRWPRAPSVSLRAATSPRAGRISAPFPLCPPRPALGRAKRNHAQGIALADEPTDSFNAREALFYHETISPGKIESSPASRWRRSATSARLFARCRGAVQAIADDPANPPATPPAPTWSR